MIGMLRKQRLLIDFRGMLGMLGVWLFNGRVVLHLHLHLAHQGLRPNVDARGAIRGEKRVWRAWNGDIILLLLLVLSASVVALFLESKERQRGHLLFRPPAGTVVVQGRGLASAVGGGRDAAQGKERRARTTDAGGRKEEESE